MDKEKAPRSRWLLKRNTVLSIGGIALLLIIVVVIGIFFRTEIHEASEWCSRTFGIPGLSLILLVSDTIISPFPPDILLVIVYESSQWSEDVLWLIPFFGLVSALGGNLGYLAARHFSDSWLVGIIMGKHREKGEALMARYGFWAVAIAAITPAPFSVLCWTAGFLKVGWLPVFWATLFRIPRLVIAYIIIAAGFNILDWSVLPK